MSALLAFSLPFDPSWPIAGLIVLLCLTVMGISDVRRFSISRAWAISGVCFRESMRRRILWLIPLAIVGVLVACQFQRALDDRDAVRATTKSFLFATGLVVTLSCILLACTNLPREIDNRVIFTIVTKPTTRLELILGKIIGFARVSGIVLIIMGLFTYGYVKIQAILRERDIVTRLNEDETLTSADRQTLQHYKDIGLLTARSFTSPNDPEIYARQPSSKAGIHSMYGGGEQNMLIRFDVNQAKLFSAADGSVDSMSGAGDTGLLIGVRLGWQWLSPPAPEVNSSVGPNGPQLPGAGPAPRPNISMELLDENGYQLPESGRMLDPLHPRDPKAAPSNLSLPAANEITQVKNPDDAQPVYAYLPPTVASALFSHSFFFVRIYANPENAEIIAGNHPGFMAISPPPQPGDVAPAVPAGAMIDPKLVTWNVQTHFRGRDSISSGQQLRGVDPTIARNVPVAVFHFGGADVSQVARDGFLPLELKTGVENIGEELRPDREEPAVVNVTLHDPITDTNEPSADVTLENLRTAFVSVPIGGFAGDRFDIVVNCISPTHYIDVTRNSVSLITGYEPFWWNLAKSLFILWMLTILVITISLFCSVFLSWPIAVVLTIVLLLGHWAVTQMSDVNGLDLGRSISTDMGLTDAKQVMVVTSWVDAETTGLNVIAVVLPDVNNFAFIQDLEQGVIVSGPTLLGTAQTLGLFGLPIAAIAYLVFKNKEVAP